MTWIIDGVILVGILVVSGYFGVITYRKRKQMKR
ncbi:hypothetical protein JOE21_002715 [Desmospora profundinema]|uniref:LPXTG cell wall anchor domain-containing protein n=1 Tax=Desmospora profundinema TaxID=1571184 RepID=A0ABU1ISG3_9BACL|nr:hypothetical protein [Desmospora profundinema]